MFFENINQYFPWVTRENLWILNVFLIIFVSLVINAFQRRSLRKLHQRFENTRNPWDDALIQSLRRPVTWLVWLLGISFAADIIKQENRAPIFELIQPAREVGVIAIITLFVTGFIKNIEQVFIQKKDDQGKPEYDQSTVEAITKLLRISAIITGVLVILQTLGFSISGVLAFGGIGGIAVGFAAKDLLANFFGGLMIYLDRPFSVGDWIRSNDRDIEGTVEKIGWRLTCIRTFDKRPLYIPNSVFANIAVENPSRMTNRRIYETVGLRYADANKVEAVIKDVKAMLQAHEEIDTNQTLIVNFNSFAPSSLDFFIYTFTKTTQWIKFHEIKQDVLLRIMQIIEQNGAEIAFPTSTVHIDPAEFQAAGQTLL